nr:hypothetical protein Q903MT_gene4845 [Picea sitchensis]
MRDNWQKEVAIMRDYGDIRTRLLNPADSGTPLIQLCYKVTVLLNHLS